MWNDSDARLIHEALEVWGRCRGSIWEQYVIVLGDKPAGLVFRALREIARNEVRRPSPAAVAAKVRSLGPPPARWKCRDCNGREAVYARVWKADYLELKIDSGLSADDYRAIGASPSEALLRCNGKVTFAGARAVRVPLYCGRCSYRLGVMSVDEWLERYDGFFEAESAADAEIFDARRGERKEYQNA